MQSKYFLFLAYCNTSSNVYPKGCSKKYSHGFFLLFIVLLSYGLGYDYISITGTYPSSIYLFTHPK